jgi:transposase
MILELHRQGLPVAAIARRTGLDRKTVRKYVRAGLEAPSYGPRRRRPTLLDAFHGYLRERVAAYPDLSGSRLLRELRELGYAGGYTQLTDFLRDVRPVRPSGFERRFETPPGQQAQVDFAQFRTEFADEPGAVRVVWLFSLVLGHSRLIWATFVVHQDLQAVLRCHAAAFEALGGVPAEILYDRMRTAVTGEDEGGVVYNATLLACARHYGFKPRACRPYRAKSKGKVERPFRYIRQDFFLARSFRNLDDLNQQLRRWLDEVANARVHATTRRVVAVHFAEERPSLVPLPAGPFQAVLRLARRVTRDGMVSVGGNLYSVPDCTRRRAVDVHTLTQEVQIFEDGQQIAAHPVLEGRGQRRIADGHRQNRPPAGGTTPRDTTPVPVRPGEVVARRPLEVYAAVGRRLAGEARA